ncbi:NlpC/P60 family protein [Streptomyces sp. NBC_01622]|uniref:NlpC/P60 family protein n=1 Tax=Streptomyces sp. NBC_01622 TaxID=2975903 RepID=UPI003863B0B0|nr:NlpC/P60 family protein [Streptomyces sp. NBC_01622]
MTEAAASLGVSEPAVRNWIRSGTLTASAGERGSRIPVSEVVALAKQRHDEAMARHPEGREALALKVIDTFWPFARHYEQQPDTSVKVVERRGDNNMSLMNQDKAPHADPDAVAVFGRPSILAAAMKPEEGVCRWCSAWTFARQAVGAPPHDDAAYKILFQGQEPCDRDRQAWASLAAVGRTMKREAEEAARVAAGEVADVKMRTDALRLAELKLGAPYVLGARGPAEFDCMGLISWAYRNAGGVDVPVTQSAMLACREKIMPKDAVPGDLLVNLPATGSGHIALYAGGGRVLHAAPGGVAYAPLGTHLWSFGIRLTRKALTAAVTAPHAAVTASALAAPDACTDDECTSRQITVFTQRRDRAVRAGGQEQYVRKLDRMIDSLRADLS